ncbi:GOLPH3/VPS74 family protein [Cellulomonas pakistanensis]|uniref:GPP34 family phosphoprotein n=1 Tax=Cellulomonas pakistanensis TaxID=992287 RepID=A0A919P7C7_9CELL|nr:GPP34 family phosphoprotein [Cellulomonas pakistanensis]GIG35436.1 hypothetical protein Cpa01nite_08170 [Cellulomonas pakistanensis]
MTGTAHDPAAPTLAEDLLLLLFDRRHGVFHGEGVPLFHVLAGAVLVDLAVQDRVRVAAASSWRGRPVTAVGDEPPADELLRPAWERAARKPVDVQQLIVETGPVLRPATVDRLVERGHLRTERRTVLGLLPVTALADGGTPRRAELVAGVRAALVDGAEPDARTAALAGLLSASGSLPALHREIPWSGAVHDRGRALQDADWGAAEAAEAVRRSVVAVLVTTAVTAAAVAPDR